MPMIIPCIDDYLDEKKRDLYWVVFGKNRGVVAQIRELFGSLVI